MTLLNLKSKKRFGAAFVSLILILTALLNLTSCGVYSFTGASVPEHLKTIAIPIADDRSGTAEPGLRENLTNQLIQRFIEDNTLQVTEKLKADALLECTIVSLSDAPAIVTAGENVDSRRMTVAVKVVYRDLVKRKTIYEKTFTNYFDYASTNPVDGRSNAITEATKLICEDILLDTVSGW